METKTVGHTPGPWHALTGGVVSNSVGPHWAHERHFVCKCDNAANAQLIAAAPELLEALDTLQACILAENGVRAWASTQYQLENAMQQALAAIAKAGAEK